MLSRYAPTTLRQRRAAVTRAAASANQYNFPNRRVTMYATHWLKRRSRHLIQQAKHCRPLFGIASEGASSRIVQARGGMLRVSTSRSVLQARNAAGRTKEVQYKAGLILPNNAATLPLYLRARLRR